ncbi:MAG: hypothetical protein V8R51_07955, partial [Clostridia bacterium]
MQNLKISSYIMNSGRIKIAITNKGRKRNENIKKSSKIYIYSNTNNMYDINRNDRYLYLNNLHKNYIMQKLKEQFMAYMN